MDLSQTVSAIPTVQVTGNTTEVIIIEEDGVEPMTIIVWCVGGILLITLLSLLGRIILAKKKQPFETLDYFEHMPVTESNNLFQIHTEGRRQEPTVFQSRDTINLVPGSDAAVTDTPVLSRTTGQQSVVHSRRNLPVPAGNCQLNEQRQIVTRNLQCGEYRNYSTSTTAQILQPDHTGSRATINGYIIRPPPYIEVISANRIPSVHVARDHSHVITARRQMFSL